MTRAIDYGDPMVSAGKGAGMAAAALTVLMVIGAGCQEPRTEGSALPPEPVRSVPARASVEEVRNPQAPTSGGAPALQTPGSASPVSEETPPGVTTNEDASAAKDLPTKADEPGSAGPAVELTLKFVSGQAVTYKVTTESQKSVEWKGAPAAKPEQFADGRSGHRIELTFEQRVLQALDDGSAVLEITIKGLRYVGESVNQIVLDFDSARPADAGNPLAKLIDRSYQVKMSPRGQVVEVSNVGPARLAVQGTLPGSTVAQKLLAEDEIRNRHEIAALSTLKDPALRPGQTWSSIKVFSFDQLGAKTYERVYTLKQAGRGGLAPSETVGPESSGASPTRASPPRLAVVEMKAIPSAAKATELYRQRAGNPFTGMSDNADSYQGRLVFDLDNGQVREYGERMQNEWILFDPGSAQDPAAIRMVARRLYQLEQVQ